MNDHFDAIVGVFVVVLIVVLSLSIDAMFSVRVLKKESIALGYAEYSPTNGNWHWKTNITK